jgi:hypothetical protein
MNVKYKFLKRALLWENISYFKILKYNSNKTMIVREFWKMPMQYESDTKSEIIFEKDHLTVHYYRYFGSRKMNMNDEGRSLFKAFFMWIRVWWAPLF